VKTRLVRVFPPETDENLQKACIAIMAFLVFDLFPEPLGLPAFFTPAVLAFVLGVAVLVVVAAIMNILQCLEDSRQAGSDVLQRR
jgi:pilus assembly protein TadC